MQIAQILSGYTLGEADILRKAMGKKIPKEMKSQKSKFIDGIFIGRAALKVNNFLKICKEASKI